MVVGGLGMGATAILPRVAGAENRPAATPVLVNQVGYLPDEPKRALIPLAHAPATGHFELIDAAKGSVRFTGELKRLPLQRGQERYLAADFDAYQKAGRYRLRLSDGSVSPPFGIGNTLYTDLQPLILNYFSEQQCGVQCSPHRKPCHLDDGIIKGGSRDGEKFDATGGWHDAGDYLKFVETTSYVVALMLLTYEFRTERHAAPTSSTVLPPLLVQAKVGLDWLLKMHPTPQQFYYQAGDKHDHDHWRLPEDDTTQKRKSWKPRPVMQGIGANLAGRTAAAFALASRHYRPFLPALAARCLAAAQSVYRLGQANRRVVSTTPSEFYPEETWQDDMQWGAAELYAVTGKPAYLKQALAYADENDAAEDPLSVYMTNALAHFRLYPHVGADDRETLLGYLQADAAKMHRRGRGNPFGLATPYTWGTAATAVGAALTCLLTARLSGNKTALETARRQRDFILGCNPFGLSCVIGVGTRFPKYPHHQAASLGKFQLTGGMIAGPTSLAVFDKQDFRRDNLEFSTGTPPSPESNPDDIGVYQDSVHDFVINEPAIDYTAQFLLLTAFYIVPARLSEG